MITSLQISKKYNHDLTDWQHRANASWIDAVWDTLVVHEGIWGYPAVGKSFCKGKLRGQWHEIGQCVMCSRTTHQGEWFDTRFRCNLCLEGGEDERGQLEVWAWMHALDSIGWRYGEYDSKATPV